MLKYKSEWESAHAPKLADNAGWNASSIRARMDAAKTLPANERVKACQLQALDLFYPRFLFLTYAFSDAEIVERIPLHPQASAALPLLVAAHADSAQPINVIDLLKQTVTRCLGNMNAAILGAICDCLLW